MNARLVLFAGLAVVAVTMALALAPHPETQTERVSRLASELRCPVCQGLSVEDSPSDTAREMRALVAQRVAEGRTDDQIRAEFRASYGDWIFLSPPWLDARGAVWLLPVATALIGVLLVVLRIGRAPAPVAATPAQLALISERARAEEGAE